MGPQNCLCGHSDRSISFAALRFVTNFLRFSWSLGVSARSGELLRSRSFSAERAFTIAFICTKIPIHLQTNNFGKISINLHKNINSSAQKCQQISINMDKSYGQNQDKYRMDIEISKPVCSPTLSCLWLRPRMGSFQSCSTWSKWFCHSSFQSTL